MLTDVARTAASVGCPIPQHTFGRLVESFIESVHRRCDGNVAEAVLSDASQTLRGASTLDDLMDYLRASTAEQSGGGAS